MHILVFCARCCCPTWIKFETCQQVLVKLSNIKFRENPFGTSRVVTWKETDRAKLTGAVLCDKTSLSGHYHHCLVVTGIWDISWFSSVPEKYWDLTKTTTTSFNISTFFPVRIIQAILHCTLQNLWSSVSVINPLKPSGKYMYHLLNINNSEFFPWSVFRMILRINRGNFFKQQESTDLRNVVYVVFFAVGTDFLNVTWMSIPLAVEAIKLLNFPSYHLDIQKKVKIPRSHFQYLSHWRLDSHFILIRRTSGYCLGTF
jgi:hypothetical protein